MIRKAVVSDAEKIFELEKQLFTDFYSLQTITADIKNKNNIYYVLELDGQFIGYALISYIFEEGNLTKIAILPDFQRRGLATMLYNACENECVKRGVEKIYLEVSDKNTPAIKFYNKLGFTNEWVRENYYSDLSDAIILQKKLKG